MFLGATWDREPLRAFPCIPWQIQGNHVDYVVQLEKLGDPAKIISGTTQITTDEIAKYFREATWEEALDKAATGLEAVHQRDGGNAIANAISSGGGSVSAAATADGGNAGSASTGATTGLGGNS